MRYKIEKFEDISDAKDIMNEYMYSCSYKFLKYMMYIIVLLIIGIIIWSLHAEKDIVTNAFGEIDKDNNICNVYVENTSIGNIKINDQVKIEIVSLAKNDYGVIESTIDNISDDVIIDKNSNKKYYVVSCHINEDALKDKNGNSVKIRNGMETKVSIVNYKTTYFQYILSSL